MESYVYLVCRNIAWGNPRAQLGRMLRCASTLLGRDDDDGAQSTSRAARTRERCSFPVASGRANVAFRAFERTERPVGLQWWPDLGDLEPGGANSGRERRGVDSRP